MVALESRYGGNKDIYLSVYKNILLHDLTFISVLFQLQIQFINGA